MGRLPAELLLVPLLSLPGLVACGGEAPPSGLPIAPPAEFVRDLKVAENAVFEVHATLEEILLKGLARRNATRVRTLLCDDFLGRFPSREGGVEVADSELEIRAFPAGGDQLLDAEALVERLFDHLHDLVHLGRLEAEADRFWLEPGGASAVARIELRVAGSTAGEERVDLRLLVNLALTRDEVGAWRVRRLDTVEGTRIEGPVPRFARVTDATGFHFNVSRENRRMLQIFVDGHRTLALGGLSAVDWNRDGFWDLLSTRRGQMALLFLNDGAGGFTPEPLPMSHPRECGSFLLYTDLDGDGSDELVGSEPLGFEGERGWCGIWRRNDEGTWDVDRRALTFENPRGLRRISVQAVIPCDLDQNQLLDLFMTVYGSALSRGERYNTVEAHDGADNHLFLQTAPGVFSEESGPRGLHGTQYSYVAEAFDFDGDGDVDLFEGNDFGPNHLWRNDGNAHFHSDLELGLGGVSAYTMGVTLGDFDNSGCWSLYISNMSSEEGRRISTVTDVLSEEMRARVMSIASGSQLYTQDPVTKRWREHGIEARVNEGQWAWGCVFWDPDGDGDLDLFATNGFTTHSDPERPDWQTYYWRQVVADGGFLARGELSQDVNEGTRFSGSFNGHERDLAFHQADATSERFYEVGWLYGIDAQHDGRCAVPVDVDGDGDLDLALWTLTGLVLYENRGQATSFARIRLEATETHRLALGAVVTLESGGRSQRSLVRMTDGFQSQVPLDRHFGLGDAERIERLVVEWPSGARQEWRDLPVDRLLTLTEGAAQVHVTPIPTWPEDTRPRPGAAPRLDLFLDRPGGGRSALGGAGSDAPPTVVRLQRGDGIWPGQRELAAAHADVRWKLILAPGSAAPPPDEGVETFFADPDLLASYFGAGEPTWPTTVLFDVEGRPRRTFYRETRPEEVDAVLVQLVEEDPFPDLLMMTGRQAVSEGRLRLAESLFQRALELDESLTGACDGLGRIYFDLQRFDLAEEAYGRSVRADPDYALGHYNLAIARMRLGRPEDALEALASCLEINGDRRRPLLALAEANLMARRPEGALDAYQRARALEPEDAELALFEAKMLGQLARLEEARQAFQAVLALDPGNEEALRGLQLVERLIERGR